MRASTAINLLLEGVGCVSPLHPYACHSSRFNLKIKGTRATSIVLLLNLNILSLKRESVLSRFGQNYDTYTASSPSSLSLASFI